MKGQDVRVLDVLAIGPAMIAGGSIVFRHAFDSGERRALGTFLILAGVGTIIYNGNNWLKQQAKTEAATAAQTAAAPIAPRT